MANSPQVKICGLRKWELMEHALNEGADFVGMILYAKSPRAVSREQAADLCNRAPSGKRVFVDVNTGTDELEGFADLGFDFFQIHFGLDVSLATLAGWSGIVGRERLWLAPKLPPGEPFPQMLLQFADTFLLDTYHESGYGGSGKTGNWQQFADWKMLYQHKRLILAGGLNPENVTAAVEQSGADFVDVNSGVESAPGEKDPARISALFAALRGGAQ